MAKNEHKQPLVHIVKRNAMPVKKAIAIRAAAIVIALLLCGVIAMILAKTNTIKIYGAMLKGAFGTKNKIWNLLQDIAILLCISLAVTPAFKMKFWNCGAEGQVLIGGLGAVTVMYFLGGKVAYPLLLVIMVAVSIVLNRLYYPTPYQFGRITEYIVLALAIFFVAEWAKMPNMALQYTLSTAFIVLYLCYAVWREKIDVKAMLNHILRRGKR